jgi:hypothetical protein
MQEQFPVAAEGIRWLRVVLEAGPCTGGSSHCDRNPVSGSTRLQYPAGIRGAVVGHVGKVADLRGRSIQENMNQCARASNQCRPRAQ